MMFQSRMGMGRVAILAGVLFAVIGNCERASAQEKLRPEDPFVSVDGTPVYLGELNLVLVQRLRAKDLNEIPIEVQQATATLLVRRHMALKSLEQQGGQAIKSIVDRQVSAFEGELKRRGSSLKQHAKANQSSEEGVRDNLKWQIAWREYLKSKMTDKNLKIFYERHRDRYAGGKWDVSQIFLTVDLKDPNSIGIVQQSMDRISDDLKNASDVAAVFAQAAKENSEGGSAAKGGRLGWITDGDIPKPLMDTVKKMKPGQVAGPIQSAGGRHLLMVHDFQASQLPFEKLADQSALRRDAADALFSALVENRAGAKIVWYLPALKPPTKNAAAQLP